MHPCYGCTGYRVNKNGQKTTSKDGRFVVGELRTINKIIRDYEEWKSDTQDMSAKDARNELRNYNSVQEKPIDIICDVDVPLLLLSPPDPLHCIRYFH